MNRGGASRASGSGAAAAAKLGDSKLLRTKHIDTLEVLETYSQDMARLQKENKSLAQQLSKFTSVSGDPYSQIASLETILAVERDSNAEMTGRIKILTGEIERQRSEQSQRETSLRDALTHAASLRSELSRLGLAHTEVLSARSALEQKLSALTSEAHELRQRLSELQGELAQCRGDMQRHAERVRQLEIQAAVGAPLPLATATAAAAAASSSEEAQTARALRAKAAKSKEKLREKEAQLARQLDELALLRGELAAAASNAAAAQSEAHKKLVAELAAAQKQVQVANAAAAAAASSASSTSARKQASSSAAKEELARRERTWNTERRDLLSQVEAARAAAAAAASAAAHAPPPGARAPTRSEQEHRELVLHLQSEVVALRAQVEHAHAQNQLLRSEHAKVSAAFNKVLAGGGVGKASVSTAGNTITIASKKGAFPEFVAAKRENEALHQQVSELRHAAHILQTRLAQAMLQQQPQPPQAQQAQTQQQAQAQGLQQARPARASVGALGSSHSSALLQPQAGSSSSSSGPSVASAAGPPRHVAAVPAGVVGSVGAPINKRSSGGWSTAAIPAGSASGAGRVRR